jgi:hypothetical protein
MTEPTGKSPMQGYAPAADLACNHTGMTTCPLDRLDGLDGLHLFAAAAFQGLVATLASP